jgi:hypothetical protein
MPLKILELGKQFRPGTTVVYPPFKNGRYMEDYFYEYANIHKDRVETDYIYIPIFWTNLQNHPGFNTMRVNYNILLQKALKTESPTAKYFTIVQHDDGPKLTLPKDTIIFGACSGTIPLPLIYEDTRQTLLCKKRHSQQPLLASFVGTLTHRVREKMVNTLNKNNTIRLISQSSNAWTNSVSNSSAELFIDMTLQSKFCLAPRGYGRSSFRFFEAMLLDCIPVYFWDDIEWLPYMEILDYSKFAVSIHINDIENTETILKSISNEKYASMQEELKRVRYYFTLEGMSEYIINHINGLTSNKSL